MLSEDSYLAVLALPNEVGFSSASAHLVGLLSKTISLYPITQIQ